MSSLIGTMLSFVYNFNSRESKQTSIAYKINFKNKQAKTFSHLKSKLNQISVIALPD